MENEGGLTQSIKSFTKRLRKIHTGRRGGGVRKMWSFSTFRQFLTFDRSPKTKSIIHICLNCVTIIRLSFLNSFRRCAFCRRDLCSWKTRWVSWWRATGSPSRWRIWNGKRSCASDDERLREYLSIYTVFLQATTLVKLLLLDSKKK